MIKKYIKETLKYLLRFHFIIRPYIREIERLYSMSDEELKQRNEKRFLYIFKRAYNCSPFYQQLYMKAGIRPEDITKIEDIEKLPIVTKEMIRNHALEILTVPKWKVISARTSGTTGSPLTLYESWESIWREQAYFYCYRRKCGYTYGEPLASLRGNLDKKNKIIFVHASNTLFLSSYNINKDMANTYYEAIERRKPKAIEGYPSSLYNLACALGDKGLVCNIPLCFTSSENLGDYQRKVIERQFNTRIYDHYGTTERSIRLSESFDHNGYFEDPGYSINEYTKDGEITTSLINSAFPLIRYKTFDLIELKKNGSIGNHKNFIQRINGRSAACIQGKDGSLYNDAALTSITRYGNNVRNIQFIQKEQGEVTLNIVIEDSFSDKNMKELRRLLKQKLGENNFDISICIVNENQLIYTSRNKFSHVISNLK